MKRLYLAGLMSLCFFTIVPHISAQTPSDAITMPKGDICFLVAYQNSSWDEYWEGTKLQPNGNIGTFTRNQFHAGLSFGISDRFDFLADVPYVKTHSDGGQLAGVSGMQDLSLAIKGIIAEKAFEKGTFYALGTAAFATRLSNYLSDYQPYSIGLGTNQFSLRAILQYKFNQGLYFRSSAAHIWRTETEVERDYYYNNGSFYTNMMDVPNAWQYQAVAGIWLMDDHLKLEAAFTGLHCTSGDDIRPWNAGQPTTKSDFQNIGGSVQYYLKAVPGLGALVFYDTVIGGRNAGKTSTIGGGVTYQFSIF